MSELQRLANLVTRSGQLARLAIGGFTTIVVFGMGTATVSAANPADALFLKQVAPIFVNQCLQCHGPKQQKGGLRLDTRAAAIAGGDDGRIWHSGDSEGSELLRRVMSTDLDERMPPKGDPLDAEEIAALRDWIDAGAVWPDSVAGSLEAALPEFWSLAPLRRPEVPSIAKYSGTAKNPVDAFVFRRLLQEGLSPSPEANRRVLIRRLYFDLLGYAPSPERIDRFIGDPDPFAYERLVDELLASPQFGERWARHWLDLVHFGETHGYDKDKPRPNAWPYRDYVIRALNDDRPYRRFVEEQLAGDALYPGSLDGLAATGFISAGPWDFIGHAEVPETKIDGKVARNLDRDDMVTATMNSFVSLTVQCARCHDHKFDAVRMEDYYAMQAVFAAVDRSDASFDPDPAVRAMRGELADGLKQAEREVAELNQKVRQAGGEALTKLERQIRDLENPNEVHPAYGYHSQIEARDDVEKWVQVDLGESVVTDRIEYMPASDDYNGIGAGFGFPVRYRIEISPGPTFEEGRVVVADYTAEDVTNPALNRQRVLLNGKSLRFVRITATKLAPRSNDYIFALAELTVLDEAGTNRASGATVAALDSIESGERWGKANLVDGIYPGIKRHAAGREQRLAELRRERDEVLARTSSKSDRERLHEAETEVRRAKEQLASLPESMKLFVGHVHTGRGAFRGTGNEGGKPRPIHVLGRGDVTRPGDVVGPGSLPLFPGAEAYFDLPETHTESARRVALARWITDDRNPLTWRSIVNRLWQHHFGRGIVDSPNDFGRMGQRPTHPELLDWLAVKLRDEGQSLKSIHRLIVTSATYRQSSDRRAEAAEVDGGNRFLWRMNRRRLDAESIRDTVLVLAQRMDWRLYGPSFQDFVVEKPEHSPHYQYHLHDPMDERSHRRSIYRFLVRSQQQPFMTTLDCADPSMMVDKRSETLTPLQALSLLNNPFMTAMAREIGLWLEADKDGAEDRLGDLFYRVTGRPVKDSERMALSGYGREHGGANLARLLLNLNEFVFVD